MQHQDPFPVSNSSISFSPRFAHDIESYIRLFANDCDCYHEIKSIEYTLKLKRDIDRLGNLARKWGMRFQPVKCNMMQMIRKLTNKIQASYSVEGTVLENVENIKYLGVTSTNDLKQNPWILEANSILLSPRGERSNL